MNGEIITIGDELISGRIADKNAPFISARFSSFGLSIKAISSVGDDPGRIVEALSRAVERSQFVIVCGGLGPTEDDITTEVAADFFGQPLTFDEKFLQIIKDSLKKWGLPWVESYRKLAYLPSGASLIAPEQACGFLIHHGQTPVFFLPGIPKEVKMLIETKVLPHLLAHDPDHVVVRQSLFKVFGLQEAQIGERLANVSGGDQSAAIGFYPNFPENHVTVTVRDSSADTADATLSRIGAEVEKRLEPYITAKDLNGLEETLCHDLREKGLKVAVAESCTGGLISSRLTSVSGSSEVFERGLVVYSNQAKNELLGVPREVIEAHGAVSEQTATYMARGVRENSGADLGLAVTGIAGPTGGSEAKPVGTVYLALADKDAVKARLYKFSGRRDQITMLSAQMGLIWLRRYLKNDSFLRGS